MTLKYYVAQEGKVTESYEDRADFERDYDITGDLLRGVNQVTQAAEKSQAVAIIINCVKKQFDILIVQTVDLKVGDDISNVRTLQ